METGLCGSPGRLSGCIVPAQQGPHCTACGVLSLPPVPSTTAIKGSAAELSVVRWMDLESVIQSEVSQKDKNTAC